MKTLEIIVSAHSPIPQTLNYFVIFLIFKEHDSKDFF